MYKRHAILLSILFAGLIVSTIYLFSPIKQKENAIIGRVIDGDTLVLKDNRTVRLLNINTPEKNVDGYEKAKKFLAEFEGKQVSLEITGKDKYNRYLARIYSQDNYLNEEIVKLGLATKFLVDKNEIKLFASSEKQAIENEQGIWKKSQFFGCIFSKIDEISEIIVIENKCSPIDINQWTIRDESRKSLKLKGTLSNKLIVNSGKGINNQTDIFWNSDTNIWNNDRDTLYILDEKGGIVYYEAYGY